MAKISKTISSFYVVPPESVTGRTITITPATRTVFNDVVGVDETISNSDVSGDDSEFYSGNYDLKKQTPIFSVSYIASAGYHFPTVPEIVINNEKSVSGFFDVETEILDSNIYGSLNVLSTLYYTELLGDKGRGFPTIEFDAPVDADPAASKKITNYTTATKITNIAQRVKVPIFGDEGAEFKVTCTGSDGTSNVVPDVVRKITIGDDFLSDEMAFGQTVGSQVVEISIPAKTNDTTWTITIVPEEGTALESGLSALSLLQEGLRTITFTDDTTGMTNTTFPDNVTTVSATHGTGTKWIERQSRNINQVSQDGGEDITIVITASSGTVTLKPRTPRPRLASSFTNINNSGILINNIKTEQTSSTVVTLRFKMRITVVTGNISSAIKLSDFLTNE